MQDYSIFAERERSGWTNSSIVEAYVSLFGPVTDEVGAAIVDRVGKTGREVLDLCCGQGTLTRMLSDAGAKVTGLDFSPDMLARAAKVAPVAALHQGDAAALPFEDDRFDGVVCNFGMMHLPDQPKALAEIRRVLKPEGTFVMATWVGPEASPAFGVVFGAIKAHADFSAAPPQPDLFAFARPETAGQMMAEAGLEMAAHEVVTPAWELSSPEELFEIFLNATVGAAMLIKSQTPAVIEAIRAQITSAVAGGFAEGAGYRVPVPVALITARRA